MRTGNGRARRAARGGAAALGAVLLASGCALFGGEPEESPQVRVAREADETRIRREVEARIAAEPSLAASRVRVEVQAGEVALHGSVPGFGALRCAMTNAELVRGVSLVIDHLELAPGPRDVACRAPRVFPAGVAAVP